MSGRHSPPHYNITSLFPIPREGRSGSVYMPKIDYWRYVGDLRHYTIVSQYPIPIEGEDGDSHVLSCKYRKSIKCRETKNRKKREHCKNLTDAFVRKTLGSNCSLKGSEFPDKMVEYRRIDLQLKRKIAQLKGVKVNQWR